MSENFEQHSYENGSTRPPKNRGGLIAAVLCVIILGSGLLTVKSIFFPPHFQDESSDLIFTELVVPVPSRPTYPAPTYTGPGGASQIELVPIPDQVENIPQSGGLGLQEIYDKNIPSVVSITCNYPDGNSSGTGVILTQDGYLVTNAHVIDDAQTIQVLLTDGRTYSAQIVGADNLSDLAVLYIAANDLTPAVFGDSATLRVGDAVAAIGDPLGITFRGTMTDGIVSAINRDVESNGRKMTLIQTNAALNSGNSGGPLINCYGQVVGINTMKVGIFSDAAGVEGLGFAIPSVMVRDIVNQLISQGYVSGRPALDLAYVPVPLFNQQFLHMLPGLYITDVPEGSEVHTGDILIAVDGQPVAGEEDLTKILYSHKAGDSVELTVSRGESRLKITVTLVEAKR